MNINFISLVIISISISFINPSAANTDQLTIEKDIINKRNGWLDNIKKILLMKRLSTIQKSHNGIN